jgi:hypoxanthine phosphoribosyltransferase
MNLRLSQLITEENIKARVEEMGQEISDRFTGEDVIAVCILKGSFIFYADLIRAIDQDIRCDFLGVSSYQGTKSSGEVKLTLDLSKPVEGKNVVLIEDIIDSGLTMNYLQHAIQSRQPKSITTVSLLHKPGCKKVDTKVDMVGFEIGDEFVVGYGLDYQGYYRNLPYIAQVQNIN